MTQKRITRNTWHNWVRKTAGKKLTTPEASYLFLKENFGCKTDSKMSKLDSPNDLVAYIRKNYVELGKSRFTVIH